jgi:hypothetical protein
MVDPAEADKEQQGSLAGSALMHIEDAYLVAEPNFDDAEYTLEEWASLEGFAARVIEAGQKFKAHARKQMASILGPKVGVRFGDKFYRASAGGGWKVKNAEGLRAWIEANDAWDLVNLSAAGAVTVTRLRERAVTLEMDPDTLAETFMEWEADKQPLTVTDIPYAPKFAAKLEHGEKYIPEPKKPAKPRLEAGE